MREQKRNITSLMAKFRQTGSIQDRRRRPRHRVSTGRQDRFMILSHLRNRRLSVAETARLTIGSHGRPISSETIRERLREAGAGPLRSQRPYRGIVLTVSHRMARLRWALRHVRFTRADLARVLFTHEKRFGSYSNDGRVRVYRRRAEIYSASCILQTEHFGGGSVML